MGNLGKNNRNITDTKVTNFRMYRVNKHWIFASAMLLSLLGSGVMLENTASADTVNSEVTTVKVDQSHVDKGTNDTAQNESANKEADTNPQGKTTNQTVVDENQSQSNVTDNTNRTDSKADTTKEVANDNTPSQESTDNSTDSTKNENNGSTKTDSNSSEQASTTNTADSKATDAKTSSTSTNDSETNVTDGNKAETDSKDNVKNDEATVKPTDDVSNIKTDSIKNADASAKKDAKNGINTVKDNKSAKSDKTKQEEKDPNRILIEEGDLSVIIDKLVKEGNSYSGSLGIKFTGYYDHLVNYIYSHKFVVEIPEELRELFSSPGFVSKYITKATVNFDGSGARNYTSSNISFDGTNLIFKYDEPEGYPWGTEVQMDINIDLGRAVTETGIRVAGNADGYTFRSVVQDLDDVTNWDDIPYSTGYVNADTNAVMPDLAKPSVNEPVYDTSTSVTGTADAGADYVAIYDANGNEIGRTTDIGPDGSFTVNITPQGEGSTISVVQGSGDLVSDGTVVTIEHQHQAIPTPTVNDAKAGDTAITGTGEAGNEIVVTDNKGNVLGKTTVDSDGNYTVDLNRALNADEDISVTQTDGYDASDPIHITVGEKVVVEKPTINQPYDGDRQISGTGEAGNTVIIYGDNGNEIGRGEVGSDGIYTIDIEKGYSIYDGEQITAVQQDKDGNTSDKATAEVKTKTDITAPTINQPYDGDRQISGTGEAGNTVIIYGDNGNEIGRGEVGSDGTYTIDIEKGYSIYDGEQITAVQQDKDGNTSAEATATVKAKVVVEKPTIDQPHEGDKKITGTGEAGNTVIIYDNKGNEIGRGEVGGDGTYTIDINQGIDEGEEITAVQQDADGHTSDAVTATVAAKETIDKPTINQPYDGDKQITGTGEAGNTVIIYDANGNEIGRGEVGSDGNYTVDIEKGYVLYEGEEITAVQQDKDGKTSEGATATVKIKVVVAKPTIDQPYDGDKKITGTGEAGNTVIIYNDKGDEIGRGEVGSDGTYSIDIEKGYSIYDGEEITAVQQDADGHTSDAATATVKVKVVIDKPTIDQPYEGDQQITGTGEAGNTVIIYDANGNEIGRGEVGSDGEYTVDVNQAVQAGEEITAVQQDADGNTSDQATITVDVKETVAKPTIDQPYDGDKKVTGTGEAGNTVIIYNDKGDEIGRGEVGSDGTYTIDIEKGYSIYDGEEITAIQQDAEGHTSDAATATVKVKVVVDQPTIDQPYVDSQQISGTGEADNTVIIYDSNGNEIGRGKVGSDGKYTVDLDRGLQAGEEVTAIQQDADGNASDPATATVQEYVQDATINQPKAGDTTISGTGLPDTTIVIYDKDGNEIGRGETDTDGNYAVDINDDVTLNAGDEITVVQVTDDGLHSKGANATVQENTSLAPPTVDDMYTNSRYFTGTGVPGCTVTITDSNGNVVGQAPVNADGTFSISVPGRLNAGDTYTAIQTNADGNSSEATEFTILSKS
ncbi:Ig-like domain-containing protein [Pediococcus pentosaceus]|uniref:Ig-like domain-containing protein n=1 Tax=Pediococcus pentosaceus TaxID=1255 RepID=UPI0025705B80|nr:Ig-like domain-containing protein [Pediococcus pentosaceus]